MSEDNSSSCDDRNYNYKGHGESGGVRKDFARLADEYNKHRRHNSVSGLCDELD